MTNGRYVRSAILFIVDEILKAPEMSVYSKKKRIHDTLMSHDVIERNDDGTPIVELGDVELTKEWVESIIALSTLE